MPPNRPPSPIRPRVTTLAVYELLDTYVRAGEDLAGRPWRLMASSMRRALSTCEQALLGQTAAGETARALAQEYANLLFGLATSVPYALENMTSRLDNPPPDLLSAYHVPIAGSAPMERGTQVLVPNGVGPGHTPFMVPPRIADASQGWAGWFVPVGTVAAFMQAGVAAGLIEAQAVAAFAPLDCGDGRAMVAVQATDYRVSDQGCYREIGLVLWVTPADRAEAEPGMLFAPLIVSDPYSVQPARAIWGLQKQCFADLHVEYGPQDVQFRTGTGGDGDFSLILPRFGTGRSLDVPVVVYSVAPRDSAVAGPARSIVRRTGDGEGLQFGGAVQLRLGRRPDVAPGLADPPPGTCFCKDGGTCLCDALRRLLPIDPVYEGNATLPAANGWSERLSGTIDGPERI